MAYINALKRAQIKGDDSEFIHLISAYVEKTLEERIEWIT